MIYAADYGADPANADNRAEIQAAIDAAIADPRRPSVRLDAGMYRISGPINVSGVVLLGGGSLVSGVQLTAPGKDAIVITGEQNGVRYPGGGLLDMFVFVDPDIVGRYAISMGSGIDIPDRFRLERLRITTGSPDSSQAQGLWERGISAIGTGRESPPGVRGGTIREVEVFNCVSHAVVLWGVNGVTIDALKMYVGSGDQSKMGLWVGGDEDVRTTDVAAAALKIPGPLNVTNTIRGRFSGSWEALQVDVFSRGSCSFNPTRPNFSEAL